MVPFKRSYPAPECLSNEATKKSGNYKCGDVLNRLEKDFFNKCYLCEDKDFTSIHVEHLTPHKSDLSLKLSWDNLFWSCAHCNTTKSTREPILNCNEDDVDRIIRYEFASFPSFRLNTSIKTENAEVNEKVNETIALLSNIYKGNTKQQKLATNGFRKRIEKELAVFMNYLNQALDENNQKTINKLKLHLRNDSPFCAFKRWKIWGNKKLNAQFSSLIENLPV